MSIESLLADRVKSLKGSAIREIFKLIQEPDIISFAGGLPAPEMFPTKELAQIAQDILLNNGTTALQYNITEGYAPLIQIIKDRMQKVNIGNSSDDLIVVSGDQQGIDLTAKVILNDGDGVICESPSFIGALNSFRSYSAKLYPVELEDDGINLDKVEAILKENKNIKLIYTIPTFQNPSGITMSIEKRKRLLDIADRYNICIIEDNPYGELRFAGEEVPTIKSMDNNNRVVYVGSFSKILSPGLRLGWIVGASEIVKKVVIMKQVNDVHTNIFAQMLAKEYMERYSMEEHIQEIRKLYGSRCNFMIKCIDKYFPDFCTHTNPQGGFFIWCNLPEGYDTIEVMKKSIENKVAFVPGYTFMTDMDKIYSSFRLNYTTMTEDKIEKGIKILGNVLKSI